jgi:hypothetical protein
VRNKKKISPDLFGLLFETSIIQGEATYMIALEFNGYVVHMASTLHCFPKKTALTGNIFDLF